jgi:transcriptional regulator GlxA family with amidase domain
MMARAAKTFTTGMCRCNTGGAMTRQASAEGAGGGASSGEMRGAGDAPLRVAFLIGDDANVMDIAGPWEVFQDARVDGRAVFELFTVAPRAAPLTASGGLRLVPHFAFDDAPVPDLIVVPAHRASEASLAWLRQASAGARITLSVCTGAFHLAAAGLLDGLAATTHHLYFDAFHRAHPQVELRRDARFVDNGRIATAGGLTSGIDLALHVVARLHGSAVAASTSRYLEYSGDNPPHCDHADTGT